MDNLNEWRKEIRNNIYWLTWKNNISHPSINLIYYYSQSCKYLWYLHESGKGRGIKFLVLRFFAGQSSGQINPLKKTPIEEPHVLSIFCTSKKVQINTVNLVDDIKKCQAQKYYLRFIEERNINFSDVSKHFISLC